MKNILRIVPLFLVLIIGVAAETEVPGSIKVAKKSSVHDWITLVRISAAEVVEIATKAAPGTVVELELEVDDGALVYEVTVVTDKRTIVDLEIDAGTGEILEKETND